MRSLLLRRSSMQKKNFAGLSHFDLKKDFLAEINRGLGISRVSLKHKPIGRNIKRKEISVITKESFFIFNIRLQKIEELYFNLMGD